MRTISEPACASSFTWIAVPTASTVSVLVIDCTRTGASPPTVTVRGPQTTLAWRERRARGAAASMGRQPPGITESSLIGVPSCFALQCELAWVGPARRSWLHLEPGDAATARHRLQVEGLAAHLHVDGRRTADDHRQ